MIMMEQNRFQVWDPKMNLAHPIKLGSWGLDQIQNGNMDGNDRDCGVAAGNLGFMFTGGDRFNIGGLSCESEHDLGMMVSDFLENGGSFGNESICSSDSDSGCNDLGHLADKILFHKRAGDQYETDLASVVRSLLLSVNENDLYTIKGDGQCNANCIRRLLVKHLRVSGYDAAVCSSKWEGFDKVPGGDHEYIDVIVNGNIASSERLIIDIDFRSHFEIARAVKSYDAILSSLPVIYVGSLAKLKQFLQIMVDAAKYSLHQNSMPLPPWRSLAYLQAKWESKFERKLDLEKQASRKCNLFSDHKQCVGHLKRLKTSLQSEIDAERLLKPITNDKKLITFLTSMRESAIVY